MPVTNLPLIQQQMIRYGMTTYLALGLFGNICNCIMFTRRQYRQTPSSIYFLYFSVFAIAYLFWAAVPTIDTLNRPDPQTTSVLFCKLRLYGRHVLGQCLRYIIIFACIDRFFATQSDVRIRSLSSVCTAKILVTIVCPAWLCLACYMPILFELKNGVCGLSGSYKFIYAIYQLSLGGILPPLLMTVFSILTIRSLHQRHSTQIRARKRDQDLIRLVFVQVTMSITTCIPYSTNLMYGAITFYVAGKSAQRLEIEAFLSSIAEFIIYLAGVIPFYIFLLTSKRFRMDFLSIIIRCWYKYIIRRNQVIPLNESTDLTTRGRQMTYSRA